MTSTVRNYITGMKCMLCLFINHTASLAQNKRRLPAIASKLIIVMYMKQLTVYSVVALETGVGANIVYGKIGRATGMLFTVIVTDRPKERELLPMTRGYEPFLQFTMGIRGRMY